MLVLLEEGLERVEEGRASLVEHARYSMTWSARPKTDGGIVSPSALAVFSLITSSTFVGFLRLGGEVDRSRHGIPYR